MGFSFCSISRKCPREMDLRIPMEVHSDHPCGLVKELQKPYVLHLIFTTACDTGRHGGAHNRNWRTDALILLSFFPYFKVNFLIFLIRTEPIYLPPPPQNHSIFLIIHLVLCVPVSRWGGDTLCCFFLLFCQLYTSQCKLSRKNLGWWIISIRLTCNLVWLGPALRG